MPMFAPVRRETLPYVAFRIFVATFIGIALLVVTWQLTSDDTQALALAVLWGLCVYVCHGVGKARQKRVSSILPVHERFPNSSAI